MEFTDTRLLRIGSHDATPGSTLYPSGAGFTVNLGNVMSQFQQEVIGYSIESVGFYNLAPNVDEGSNTIEISATIPQVDTYVVPVGQYTISELIDALNIAVAGDYVFSIVNERVTIAAGALIPLEVYGERFGNSDILATNLGFIPGILNAPTAPNSYNCGGKRVAFLHSASLAHNKYSVDAEGLPASFSCSFPINVPYGNFNLVYPNQYQQAGVWWDETFEVREIQIRLRDIRGRLLNLQGTEWFVTLRLFLQ